MPQVIVLSRRCLACTWAFVIVATGGCGSGERPTYRAGGIVTFPDGKPLTSGWIEFQLVGAKDHTTARGQIQSDGTFALGTYRAGDGAVEGEYQALVAPLMPATDAEVRARPSPIDPRFRSFETSGLRFTVKHDISKNRFSIQVEPPGR